MLSRGFDTVYAAAWSSYETIAFGAGTKINQIDVYDSDWYKVTPSAEGHISLIYALAWSPDGQDLASASADKTVHVYKNFQEQHGYGGPNVLEGHAGWVYTVAWSPDGKRVVSGSIDKTVIVWDIDNKKLVYTYRGHSGRVKSVAWSPDGKRIASADDAGEVHVWPAP